MGGTKLEIFFHKNQHTKRKILNFEFWINGELSKIGHHFSNNVIKLMLGALHKLCRLKIGNF